MLAVIDRSAVVLLPKQPMLDWMNSVSDEPVNMEDASAELMTYLVPSIENDEEAMNVMSSFYEPMFEAELGGWDDDESKWPEDRGFEVFVEWFDVAIQCFVCDLVDDEEE